MKPKLGPQPMTPDTPTTDEVTIQVRLPRDLVDRACARWPDILVMMPFAGPLLSGAPKPSHAVRIVLASALAELDRLDAAFPEAGRATAIAATGSLFGCPAADAPT